MASTYGRPVAFTKEGNVWTLSARVVFNPSGVAVLDTNNSKGICAVNQESIAFNAGTTNSTTTMGTVSSFAGLFSGMVLTDTAGILQANTVIGSMSAAGDSLLLSKQAIISSSSFIFNATGGRYLFQFGQQAAQRLDTYYKLLYVRTSWDESTSSAIGTATSLALSPSAPGDFVVKNNIAVRTIPQTLTSGSTDASISLQFGYYVGQGFTAASPATGESCRVLFVFGNLSAP